MTRIWKEQCHRPDYQKGLLHILTLLINGTAPQHPTISRPPNTKAERTAQHSLAAKHSNPSPAPVTTKSPGPLRPRRDLSTTIPSPPRWTPAFGPSIKRITYTAQGQRKVAPMPNPNQDTEGAPRTPAATQAKMDISPSPPRQVNQEQDKRPSPPSPKPPKIG